MKSSRVAFPLIALCVVILGAACGQTAGTAGEVVTCQADGDACHADDDCCDFVCGSSGTCIANTDTTCVDDNGECSINSDCCSGTCAADFYCGE
jgi:hypothetical protein